MSNLTASRQSRTRILAVLVLSFAALLFLRAGVAQAAAKIDLVAPASVEAGQAVPFSASAEGGREVRFLVDGKQRWRAPITGDSLRRSGMLRLPSGRHRLVVRAIQASGKASVKRRVTVVRGHGKTSWHENESGTPTTASTTNPVSGDAAHKSGGPSGGSNIGTGSKVSGSPTPTPTAPTTPTPPTTPTAPATPTTPTAPTTPTTPTPPSGEAGKVLFSGTRLSQYLNQSAPGAVTEIPDPAGSGESVFQLNVSNADVFPITPTENPRAELVSDQNIRGGAEFWASMKFYLPTSFPTSTSNWLTLLEGPYGEPWAGTPPWHLEVNGDKIQWQRNGTYNWDIPWQMNLVRGSWVNVLLHERFAGDGWIEMWINGQPVTFFANTNWNPGKEPTATKLMMQTMDSSTNIGPSSFHLMNYRKAGILETATVDQGPLRIGTTRASVEPS